MQNAQVSANKTTCLLCNRRIVKGFVPQWKHMAKAHPDVLVGKILPLAFDPESAQATGREIAKRIFNV